MREAEDLMDLARFPYHRKPYAESTLRGMRKSELIEIIRDYEHNYSALYDTYKQAVRNAEAAAR